MVHNTSCIALNLSVYTPKIAGPLLAIYLDLETIAVDLLNTLHFLNTQIGGPCRSIVIL